MRQDLLAARRCIVDADGLAAVDRVDAVAHADARPDLRFATLDDLPGDVRVSDMRPRHRHHIKLAAGNRMTCRRHVLDTRGMKRGSWIWLRT